MLPALRKGLTVTGITRAKSSFGGTKLVMIDLQSSLAAAGTQDGSVQSQLEWNVAFERYWPPHGHFQLHSHGQFLIRHEAHSEAADVHRVAVAGCVVAVEAAVVEGQPQGKSGFRPPLAFRAIQPGVGCSVKTIRACLIRHRSKVAREGAIGQ